WVPNEIPRRECRQNGAPDECSVRARCEPPTLRDAHVFAVQRTSGCVTFELVLQAFTFEAKINSAAKQRSADGRLTPRGTTRVLRDHAYTDRQHLTAGHIHGTLKSFSPVGFDRQTVTAR